MAIWGDDGSGVNGSVTVLGNDVTQCGSLDVDSGQAYLEDCSQLHSFLCVKTHGMQNICIFSCLQSIISLMVSVDVNPFTAVLSDPSL